MAELDPTTGAFVPDENASLLGRVLDEYFADLQAGRNPDRAALLARHPTLAAQLDACLAGIDFIQRTSRMGGDAPAVLGDFRIAREVGRGGMGVVYEAEQISLKRRVALKVLRFGSVADAEAMQRFQREAETVARLHHTNIVPIFAVGQEQGVHYYAMQFIVGKSLADLLPALRPGPARSPLTPEHFRSVARWGLQAAEALAHAHQRGVIHRDIKPSNLLLDSDDILWLTDFGLAKRADEVTMTISGVLLGTPRYMSPEQAAAAKQPVDHRTDLYSLGASLYELATGTPVFTAETPHAVLSQILHSEPAAPRQIEPAMPRDLETIVLKCLAKEPGGRYENAQALADDLRAFLDGRAIKARRISLVERTVRWARKQRRSSTVAAVSVLASLLVMIGATFGWSRYAAGRMAHLSLTTSGDHLKAEVLDEAETRVLASFTVPTQDAQPIEPGAYKVRLSGAGQPSETYRFQADKGVSYKFNATPINRPMWSVPLSRGMFEPFPVAGKTDVLTIHQDSLSRIDGTTGQTTWSINFFDPAHRTLAGNDSLLPFFRQRDLQYPNREPPALVRPVLHIDDDEIPDPIYASRTMTALAAFSGQNGKLLWYRNSRSALPKGVKDDDLTGRFSSERGVIGTPLRTEIDGRPAVIAVFDSRGEDASLRANGERIHIAPELWLEAFAAKTGQSLWRFTISRESNNEVRPMAPFAMRVMDVAGKPTILLAVGPRLAAVDVASGAAFWTMPVPGEGTLRSIYWVSLADGEAGAIVERDEGQRRLVELFGPKDGKARWQASLGPPAASSDLFSMQEVVAADLDGDGQEEVIVLRRPESPRPEVRGFLGIRDANSSVYRDVEVCALEAGFGRERWRRRIKTMDVPLERILVGPDANQDKKRDVYIATVRLERTSPDIYQPCIYVDALSGADGTPLWWGRAWELSAKRYGSPHNVVSEFEPLRLGPPGPDGRPMLLVTCTQGRRTFDEFIPATYAFSCGDGKLRQVIPQFSVAAAVDLNGDGLLDLVGHDMTPTRFLTEHGKLRTLRSFPPSVWAMFGTVEGSGIGADYDGDGTTDIAGSNVASQRTFSGADGDVLWTAATAGWSRRAFSLPHGDLDGDGVADMLSMNTDHSRLVATSGKSGALLWSTKLLEGYERIALVNNRLACLECRPMRDEEPGVLLMAITHSTVEASADGLRMMRLDGRTGKVLWNVVLHQQKPNPADRAPKSPTPVGEDKGEAKPEPMLAIGDARFQPSIADVNGDGVRDVILWCPSGRGVELRVHDGRDGAVLWRRPMFKEFGFDTPRVNSNFWPAPVVLDGDGDGTPEIVVTNVVVTPDPRPDVRPKTQLQVTALSGRDGGERWTWEGDPGVQISWANQWQLAQPRLVEHGTAGTLLCVAGFDRGLSIDRQDPNTGQLTKGTSGVFVTLLDRSGKQMHRLDLPEPLGFPLRPQLWVHDLDGDGQDDILCLHGPHLRALAISKKDDGTVSFAPRWKWEFPPQSQELRTILPAEKDRPAVVVVRGDDKLLGLDGRDGTIRWRCEGGDVAHALPRSDATGLPYVLFHGPPGRDVGTTHCRLALPTIKDGRYASFDPAVVATRNERDPRLARHLPWAWRGDHFSAVAFFVLAPLAAAGIFGLLPLLLWFARRAGWRMRSILLVLVALGLIAWLIAGAYVGYGWHSIVVFTVPLVLVGFSLIGLPGWVYLVALGRPLWQRRWRRACGMLLYLVAVAAALAALLLFLDRTPVEPGAFYIFAGWYGLLPVAVTGAGLLLILGLVLMPLTRLWRRRPESHVPA